MSMCREFSAFKRTQRNIYVHSLYCGCWDCQVCHERNRRRVYRTIRQGNPTAFLTLTLRDVDAFAQDKPGKWLARAFRHLVKRIRRRYPDCEVEYAWVMEATKRGVPHLHAVLRAPFIPQSWLSEQWAELTGARVVHIRAVDNAGNGAKYVCKYLTKDNYKFDGTKRWHKSRGWLTKSKSADDTVPSEAGFWNFSYNAQHQWIPHLETDGYPWWWEGQLLAAEVHDLGRPP